jgi:hypothetical protein
VRLDFAPQVAVGTSGNTAAFASLNRATVPAVAGSIGGLLVGRGLQSVPNFLAVGGYRSTCWRCRAVRSGAQCYVAPAAGQRCTPSRANSAHRCPPTRSRRST